MLKNILIPQMIIKEMETARGSGRRYAIAYIGGQIRAHFFKSVHKSAKCAVGRKIAHFFDVL
jgi:hypothetical protein